MRKTVVALSIVLTLGACSKPTEPNPVPTITQAPITQEPSRTPTVPPREDPTVPSETVEPREEPTKAPTSLPPTDSEPPSIAFLKRWGQQYPNVEEANIIRAGTDVCEIIATKPDNWQTSNDFANAVAGLMQPSFGNVSLTKAASFAVDANQNLCPSLP